MASYTHTRAHARTRTHTHIDNTDDPPAVNVMKRTERKL